MRAKLLVLILLALVIPSYGFTQTIGGIIVEGTERIDPATVRSYLTVKPGDAFDTTSLDEILKTLFNTGLFSDVSVRQQESDIIITVQENPSVNRVSFEGNDKLKDSDLQNEVQLRPRAVFTRPKVQSDVQRLLQVYRRSGRFAVRIEPKIVQLEQNRVDVVFEINEGVETAVNKIVFIGNRFFSDSALQDEIVTKTNAWYRFLNSDDIYDPDRLNFDNELLRRFYAKEGFADFRVVSVVGEYIPEQQGFTVTFTVDEGPRYTYGTVALESKLRGLDPSVIEPLLTDLTPGDWYNANAVQKLSNNINDQLGNLGYAFVQVQPELVRRDNEAVIDLTYNIVDGPKVFVERININGNVRTLDKVLRREVTLVEGDAFNKDKVRRSEQNLRDLNYFKTVEVDLSPGSTDDRTVMNVNVEEKSTGELSFGAGYSTTESFIGDVRIRERNLLGRGQDLTLGTRLSGERSEVQLSFTEPYFLDRKLQAGFDLFRTTRDQQEESSYDEERAGFVLRTRYFINDELSHGVSYTYKNVDISNVQASASRFISSQAGETVTSSISHSLMYDERNSKIDPTDGFFIRFGNELAGIGGDSNYLNTTFNGGIYYAVAEEWVLGFEADAGYIVGLGEDVRLSDRFFIGGRSFRGFETAGIGPRDRLTGDALGGNAFGVVTSQLSFPLGLSDDLGVGGHLFSDIGTLAIIDEKGTDVQDDSSLRASIGLGVSWQSPVGPIRLDFAYPVLKEKYDETQSFLFNFGTRF